MEDIRLTLTSIVSALFPNIVLAQEKTIVLVMSPEWTLPVAVGLLE